MSETLKVDLKVVPKHFDDEFVQKLELPYDPLKYPFKKPCSLVLCKTASQNLYICYQFSMIFAKTLPNNCYLNTSVQYHPNTPEIEIHKSIFANLSTTEYSSHLKEITHLPESMIFCKVSLDVYLERVYCDEVDLTDTLREMLPMFTFTTNCVINVKSLGSYNFGIKNIFVHSCDDGFGTTNELTEVTIRRIFYLGNSAIKYTPIGGLSSSEDEINNIIQHCQKISVDCEVLKPIQPCLHALIYGFNGVGKTALIHNQIINNKCSLFEIRSADILRPYPGETEMVLREIFANANQFGINFFGKCTPVILIEDVDVLCPKVKPEHEAHLTRISNQIMILLDELHRRKAPVVVLATTSNIEILDLRMRRPGRMEREILVGISGETQRLQILETICKDQFRNCNFGSSALLRIAECTPGYVGADLKSLTQYAWKFVSKNHPKQEYYDEDIMLEAFMEALKNVHASTQRGLEVVNYLDLPSLSKLAGLESLKKTLDVAVLVPLRHPDSFRRFNLPRPKGILLYGPPGCAKTTIAMCLAHEAKMSFISASGAAIYSPYLGSSEKFIANLFCQARLSSPCVLFLDEIDSIVGSRSVGMGNNNVSMQVLSTLLIEMDGIGIKVQSAVSDASNDSHVLVIAATNRPDLIDDALMRPGRFDKLIHVRVPDADSRLEILQKATTQIPINEGVDLRRLAEKTKLYSGADLFNLCKEAALNALTNSNNSLNLDSYEVTEENFNDAFSRMRPSLSQKEIDFYNEFEQKHRWNLK